MNEYLTTIDFIRHGQPEGGSRYRGSGVDDPLSKLGWEQMWASLGSENNWDQIISSPLLRCSQFARSMAEKFGRPLAVEHRLREVGFGTWEGLTRAEVKAKDHNEYRQFYANPVENRPAGAEPLADFGKRVAAAYDHIVETFGGKNVLVVAHAGVIRATLGHVLRMAPSDWYRVKVDNAGVTRFQADRHGSTLVFHNLRHPVPDHPNGVTGKPGTRP